MNQNDPETYALTARCPLADAVRLRALARSRGITASALVAQLVHSAVADVPSAPAAEATSPPSSSAPPPAASN